MGDLLVEPGDTIGILGSGQLGRMLAMAAARLGIRSHIYCPESGPAFDVAAAHTKADYDDDAALAAFAAQVKVVTYEFETVPSHTAEFLSDRGHVHPNARALAIAQDRLSEKRFLNGLGIPTAPFLDVDDAEGLARAVTQLGRPSILKTRRFGYDGKGQVMIREGSDLAVVFRSLGGAPSILEGVVPFSREVSVVAARGRDGTFADFALSENQHENHILSLTRAPALVSPETANAARAMTAQIAQALDYVGVLAVEMFLVETQGSERLVVNEIAPRVHNSGHWTIDGAVTSQFEQHIRAICGLGLGSAQTLSPAAMVNLIGDGARRVRALCLRQ